MSRILLLLIFLLWMAGWNTAPSAPAPAATAPAPAAFGSSAELAAGLLVFVGFYALLVLAMRVWSVLLARRVAAETFERSLNRFQRVMLAARMMVPAWFGVGLFVLYWGDAVAIALTAVLPRGYEPLAFALQLPGLVLGTLPAFAAWVGLWWSQYPADRALREQNMLIHVEAGLPVHPAPTPRQYLGSNLRLQVLFTVVPILLIVLLRDVVAVVQVFATGQMPTENVEVLISVGAAAVVFVIAPEVLRRVLQTQPLPDSPLRRRLEDLCRRTRMRYRDILLWKTQNNMGNAAVMGIIPQVRYILLSDLLLEQMDDEQIEAVFAHEVGHVVHRHMGWFVLFFVMFIVGVGALEKVLGPAVDGLATRLPVPDYLLAALSAVGMVAAFLVLFGFISRRFERQADVYAARTMEAVKGSGGDAGASTEGSAPSSLFLKPEPPTLNPQTNPPVGHYGATVFASALHRVAMINNIPIHRRRRRRGPWRRRVVQMVDDAVDAAHNWFHGSIASRMDYLRGLSADPSLTGHFDRRMIRLYCTLLLGLCASAAFWVATVMR